MTSQNSCSAYCATIRLIMILQHWMNIITLHRYTTML